jgi:hypothetical protein
VRTLSCVLRGASNRLPPLLAGRAVYSVSSPGAHSLLCVFTQHQPPVAAAHRPYCSVGSAGATRSHALVGISRDLLITAYRTVLGCTDAGGCGYCGCCAAALCTGSARQACKRSLGHTRTPCHAADTAGKQSAFFVTLATHLLPDTDVLNNHVPAAFAGGGVCGGSRRLLQT